MDVQSSNVKSVHHNEDGSILTVEFHSGKTYQFEGVKRELFEAFMRAPSKGKFLHRWIAKYKKGKEV